MSKINKKLGGNFRHLLFKFSKLYDEATESYKLIITMYHLVVGFISVAT